jgi:hypothetical protein
MPLVVIRELFESPVYFVPTSECRIFQALVTTSLVSPSFDHLALWHHIWTNKSRQLLISNCIHVPAERWEVGRWDIGRIRRMGQQCELKLVQSLGGPRWIADCPIIHPVSDSFNSTFPGNGDSGALGPFQNNITKYWLFILSAFGQLSNGNKQWVLNLSVKIDFFESIFRCARLGTVSLDVLYCDEWA